MISIAPLLVGWIFGQGLPEGAVKVDFAKPVKIALASAPVEYHGNKISILSSGEVSLQFGSLSLRPKPVLPNLNEQPNPPIVWGVRWGYFPPKPEPEPFPYLVVVEPTLKATLKVAVAQYNRVDYRVYGAVYDAKGKLLGAASAVEAVQYARLGIMPTLFREVELDFGNSKGFADAAYIAFAVSNPDVPKPPDG